METQVELEVEEQVEQFRIDSEDRANWFIRKVATIETERRRVEAQALQIINGLNADEARLRARFEAELAEWAEGELARKGGRSKTLALLQGTCAFRTVPATVKVSSPDVALEYAKEQGWDCVSTIEKLDGAAYRQQAAAALQETGEVLPGTEVVSARESFKIVFGKDKTEQEKQGDE